MKTDVSGTHQKVLRLNRDPAIVGVFALTERFEVSRRRLSAMLEREFRALEVRWANSPGEPILFVFADAIGAHLPSRGDCKHSWMGVRFQIQPKAAPSEVLLHAELRNGDAAHHQETLGGLALNLIYGAMYHHQEPELLTHSLMDGLDSTTIEVNAIQFAGPAFEDTAREREVARHLLARAAILKFVGGLVGPC